MELDVEIAANVDADQVRPIVMAAVLAADVSGVIREALTNTFTLVMNGRELTPVAAPYMGRPPLPDPQVLFDAMGPVETPREHLVLRAGMTALTDEVTSHDGSSYAVEQHRTLHLRGVCMFRPDGVKVTSSISIIRTARYRIVQDTRFAHGQADPVETHVYLDTLEEDEHFAREVLDMGERTCFLHALCRTEVSTRVNVITRPVANTERGRARTAGQAS